MQNPRAYVGTSGWNYRDWRGVLYPRGLRQADWFAHFASQFDTVEVNTSFYRIPKAETVIDWAEAVPGRFRFAVKLWRGITQFRKLQSCRGYLESFFEVIQALPTEKRGPILVQLPPNFRCNVEKLDAFLDDVRDVTAPARWKVAVEFRNESWLCDEIYRLLDRQRCALCLHDMRGRAPVAEPNDASFVYVRRHGPSGEYQGGYQSKQIKEDAELIRRWLKAGKAVFVYYNNDVEGHAVRNAKQLLDELAR